MKVRFSVVGQTEQPNISDINLESIPQVNDSVYVPEINGELSVRTVIWFPWGEEDGEEPFVYVVIGPARS